MGGTDIGKEGLRVAIGLPSAVLLVVGGVIGVGIFVNPAVVARGLHSPVLVLAAWTLGGLIALLGAFVYGELAARMPQTGGEYAYLRATYGPLAAFLFGWTTLLVVQAGGLAAVVIVFAANVNVLAGGGLSERVVVIATLAGLAGVNCIGVRSGNGVQTLLGVLKIVVLVALIGAGLFLAPAAHPRATASQGAGVSLSGIKAFGAALIPVMFSIGGWQTANYVAGELKDSSRNLVRALMAGVLTVIAIYLLVNVACLRALGVEELGRTLTPASDVLGRAVGGAGARLAAAAIAISAIGFLSQGMLTGPRVTFAMARDGLFFRGAAKVGVASRTPVMAIVLQAIWAAVLALSGSFEQILSYVTAMNFLFFGLTASSLFVIRRRETRAGKGSAEGFRTPLHPLTTGLFIVACVAIVGFSFWAQPRESLIGYGILLLGVPPYLFWRRASALAPAIP